jgi:hypothetical protein
MQPRALELDRHLRRFFPELVRKLQQEGSYEEHLQKSAERWSRVYGDAVEKGLSHIQAVELARDAVFPEPEPFQEPCDDQDFHP